MSAWPKNIERHWFAIARSAAVTGKPGGITLFGRPGATDALPEVRVPALTVVERDGLVWAAARAITVETLPRRIVELDSNRRRFLWQTRWGAPILETLENFLDPMHTHLIHPGLVRRDAQRTLTTGRWAPAWAVKLLVWPFLRRVARQDQRILEFQTRNLSAFSPQRPVITDLDLTRPYLESWWSSAPTNELPKTRQTELML